ncbi:helix-turn-helix domain-containing protein [uncultured Oscillibacter sp.]|uniref:helix-turn-helix domain-containing protein n=1 Tax=uncultured Oscillibacter sp. TaxID=876091 RepID=UPI0025DC11A3|nr:helix-turn-helix transcriptional regulator [uncultured Oscillibacter sp.]
METILTFGSYIKQRRESLGYTIRGFAGELDIAPAFLCDIERGNRFPARKHLKNFISALHIEGDEADYFYDLYAAAKNSFPDLNEYIADNSYARIALRKARDNGVSDRVWQAFIASIEPMEDQS